MFSGAETTFTPLGYAKSRHPGEDEAARQARCQQSNSAVSVCPPCTEKNTLQKFFEKIRTGNRKSQSKLKARNFYAHPVWSIHAGAPWMRVCIKLSHTHTRTHAFTPLPHTWAVMMMSIPESCCSFPFKQFFKIKCCIKDSFSIVPESDLTEHHLTGFGVSVNNMSELLRIRQRLLTAWAFVCLTIMSRNLSLL